MPATQNLTNDDLIWIIGQKEATLLLVTRQAHALLAENEALKSHNEHLSAELSALKTTIPTE